MRSKRPASGVSFDVGRPTIVLLGTNVLVYAAMLAVGRGREIAAFSTQTLMRFGADYAPLVLEGQVQRLVTSMFLHLNPLHLLLNMAALMSIGPALEERYGRMRFVLVYFASGLVGSLASVAWHFRHPAVSAGASGALCGIIAAGAVAAHVAGPSGHALRNSLAGWLLATLGFGVLIHADNAAHLGGMAAGALLGRVLLPRKVSSHKSTLPSFVSVAIVLLAFGATIAKRGDSETAGELVNRGVDLARGGDDEGAAKLYRRAVELEPRDAVAYYDLGLALERLGDYDGAVAAFQRSIAIEPDEQRKHALAICHFNQGLKLGGAGDSAGALEAYKKALDVAPDDAAARANLGATLLSVGDHETALRELAHAHELAPKDAAINRAYAGALVMRGNELATNDKHREAIAVYRKAIEIDAEDWRAHLNLGLALLHEKQFDKAVASFERAHQLEPSEVTKNALASGLEARADARNDAGKAIDALDDIGRATTLRLAPLN